MANNRPSWEEIRASGQLDRGMPRENYGPSVQGGQGQRYDSNLNEMGQYGVDPQRMQLFNLMKQYGEPPNNEGPRQLSLDEIKQLQQIQAGQSAPAASPQEMLQNQQQQLQPRSYARPFETPAPGFIQEMVSKHPLNRLGQAINQGWNGIKNYQSR